LINKARVLAQRFKYKTSAKSTDRLRRVQQESRYSERSSSNVECGQSSALVDGPNVAVTNPVASLIRCDGHAFLCIGELNSIWFNSQPMDDIPVSILHEKAVKVSYQVINLVPAMSIDDPTMKHDWRSSLLLPITFTVPGALVHPIDPSLGMSESPDTTAYFIFDSSTLLTLASTLHDRLAHTYMNSVPSIKVNSEFPYRECSGAACFVTEGQHNVHESIVPLCCPNCMPEHVFNDINGQDVLEHIGSHVLFDPSVDHSTEPCGLCLQSFVVCRVYLKKGRGRNGGLSIHRDRTTCPNEIKFSYNIASKSSASSPCSNVPLYCPICPSGSSAVWRYNLKAHFAHLHESVPINTYEDLWTLSETELQGMKIVWKDRTKQIEPRKKRSETTHLVISEVHSSRNTAKYVIVLV
ncbi:hypothetical protein BC834DRAFT_793882, partial [Gloeopeniophorella convolvens]